MPWLRAVDVSRSISGLRSIASQKLDLSAAGTGMQRAKWACRQIRRYNRKNRLLQKERKIGVDAVMGDLLAVDGGFKILDIDRLDVPNRLCGIRNCLPRRAPSRTFAAIPIVGRCGRDVCTALPLGAFRSKSGRFQACP